MIDAPNPELLERRSVEHAAERILDARFERFEGSGHGITIEEPERSDRVVRGFDDSLARTPGSILTRLSDIASPSAVGGTGRAASPP